MNPVTPRIKVKDLSPAERNLYRKLGKDYPTAFRHYKHWTAREESYIRAHYLTTTDKQMAEHLGRPWRNITSRRVAMGLYRYKQTKRQLSTISKAA